MEPHFSREDRTGDQHDVYCIAAWLMGTDRDGTLPAFMKPELTPPERTVAGLDGRLLGVASQRRVLVQRHRVPIGA